MTAVALAMTFVPSRWSALAAWTGLLFFVLSGNVVLSTGQMVFWAVAAAMVAALGFLLPQAVARSRHGVTYIAVGTLLGVLIGMLASGAAMIVGAAAGALAGGVAFSRTPGGRNINFPSRQFFNYLGAKGLPAVVTLCILGIALALLISQHQLISQ